MRYLLNTPFLTRCGDYRLEGPLLLATATQFALQPLHNAIGHARGIGGYWGHGARSGQSGGPVCVTGRPHHPGNSLFAAALQ